MFEPFHPLYVPKMRHVGYFKYLRPHCENEAFYALAREVFTGNLQHHRIDGYNKRLFYNGLLIKDIYANLFISWVHVRFPAVKKIFLLRHPFAAALSKQKLKDWSWMTEPSAFLGQRALYEDYLKPFETLIKRTEDFFEKQVLIWSIIHYVPLRQLNEQDVLLVFYEELASEPERELKRLFAYLYGLTGRQAPGPKPLERIRKPSRFSRKNSAIKQGKNLCDGWRKELSRSQVDKGLEILRAFGLDRIYSDRLMPDREAAERLLRA